MIRLDVSHEAQASAIAVRHHAVQVSVRVEISQKYTPSPEAAEILGYLAGSSKLSKDQKHFFARMAAFIDEYAGADHHKLMRTLAAVIQLTEMTNAQRGAEYERTTAHEMLRIYQEERAAITGDVPRNALEIHLLLEQTSIVLAGTALEDAMLQTYDSTEGLTLLI